MTRLMVAALVYPMAQAVLFGVGVIVALILAPGFSPQISIPLVVVITALISMPLSWFIAPKMMVRYQKRAAARLNQA